LSKQIAYFRLAERAYEHLRGDFDGITGILSPSPATGFVLLRTIISSGSSAGEWVIETDKLRSFDVIFERVFRASGPRAFGCL
jgi:hypothetical protein